MVLYAVSDKILGFIIAASILYVPFFQWLKYAIKLSICASFDITSSHYINKEMIKIIEKKW